MFIEIISNEGNVTYVQMSNIESITRVNKVSLLDDVEENTLITMMNGRKFTDRRTPTEFLSGIDQDILSMTLF